MSRRKTNRRKRPMKVRFASAFELSSTILSNLVPLFVALSIALAVPTLVYFAYNFVVGSSHFALSKIEIHGTDRVEQATLLEQMSILQGMNIFDVHSERAIHSAKNQPWIKNIRMEIQYPDKVIIHIVEHVPVAIADFRMGIMFVDAEGELITESQTTLGLPYLSGTSRLQRKEAKEVFLRGIQLHKDLKAQNFGAVSELNYDEHLGFSAILLNGTEIRIGHDKFESRLKRVKRVLQTSQNDENIAYLLVDHAMNSNRVIVGYKTEINGSEEPVNAYQGR